MSRMVRVKRSRPLTVADRDELVLRIRRWVERFNAVCGSRDPAVVDYLMEPMEKTAAEHLPWM